MFDQTRTVTVAGTVSGFAWTNPHIFIGLEVRGTNGKTIMYKIEGGSPSIHMRSGWKANSLKIGDRIKATMYPLRSGEPGGRVKEVTTATGTVLSLASGIITTPGQ